LNLDYKKLPLGSLKIERIRHSKNLLVKIEKQLGIMATGVKQDECEKKILALSEDYYKTFPYDFGLKKCPGIDHALRVKEKIKQMDLL
jgi:hypothetical protein